MIVPPSSGAMIGPAGRLHLSDADLVALTPPGRVLAGSGVRRCSAKATRYPTALLPSQAFRWEAVDARSATATLVDGPLTLTLLFQFNDAGLIDSVRAEARGARIGKKMVMIPWGGRWSDYQTRDGKTVLDTGDIAWLWPEGRRSDFRGTVTSMRYEYLP